MHINATITCSGVSAERVKLDDCSIHVSDLGLLADLIRHDDDDLDFLADLIRREDHDEEDPDVDDDEPGPRLVNLPRHS